MIQLVVPGLSHPTSNYMKMDSRVAMGEILEPVLIVCLVLNDASTLVGH